MFSFKDEVRNNRSRATGTTNKADKWAKPRATATKAKRAEEPEFEADEVFEQQQNNEYEAPETYEIQQEQTERQYTPIDDVDESEVEVDQELLQKVTTARASYVEKKLTAERNLRLRQGKGYMSKSELKSLRKRLKAEAAAKYTVNTVSLDSQDTTTLRLSANTIGQPPAQMPEPSTPQRLEQQKKAREEAKRFLDSQVEKKRSVNKGLKFDPSPKKSDDDAFWKAEEQRWKAELDARRTDGQQQVPAFDEDHQPQQPQEAESAPEDICLRSQLVVKSPHDSGLGIQLYTPPNEQGVRITKIDPFGPFGRTGAFEDGDVIVEVDGTPLLYGGHAAVLAAITEAMRENAEMVVTVCSTSELAKLEALVDVDEDTNEGEQAKPKPQGTDWMAKLNSTMKSMGSLFKIAPSKPATQQQPKPAEATQAATAGPSSADTARYTEPAYLIYRADIRDLEAYRNDYMCKTTELIQKYGGRWLARGGKVEALEGGTSGETVLQRMVLIEFPSMDAAKSFFRSAEYQEARQARLAIATAELTVLEGMRPSACPMP